MFETLGMIEGSISSYGQAMQMLASDVQAFQEDGYKKTKYTFVSLYSQSIAKMGGSSAFYGRASNTQNLPQGVTLLPMGLDFNQGALRQANQLNSAILGNGLFVLRSGNSTDYLYTRASNFVFDSSGNLVDSFGRQVMGYKMNADGTPDKSQLVPIKVDSSVHALADVGFEDGGVLSTNYAARKTARDANSAAGSANTPIPEGTALFQLAMARVPNPSGLTIQSGDAFSTSAQSGSVVEFGVSENSNFGQVMGGFAESSNVDPAETTIIGIQLQRGYNAVQSALSLISRTLSSFLSAIDKA